MKCYIPTFNLLSWTRDTVLWLVRHGIDPVILDNGSTYPPLLEWYESRPCEIVRFTNNMGHLVLWKSGMIGEITENYYVTDPDLDFAGIPDDFPARLQDALNRRYARYSDILKVGFSIEINDIPEMNRARKYHNVRTITEWEEQWWKRKDGDAWLAACDTSFALYVYRPGVFSYSYSALRLDRPYTVRHLPWYLDYSKLDEEYAYYVAHAAPGISHAVCFARNEWQ